MGPDPESVTTGPPDPSRSTLTVRTSAVAAAAGAVRTGDSEPAVGSAVLAWKALPAKRSAVSATRDNLPYLLIGLLLALRDQPLHHVPIGLDESRIVDLLPERDGARGGIDRDHAAVVH